MSLPLIIKHNLDILFCGINPGISSGETGLYFAHSTNQFWSILSEVLNTSLKPEDQWKCLDKYNIGFMNMINRTTRTANELHQSEYKDGVNNLINIVDTYNPKILCFIGRGLYTNFKRYANISKITTTSKDGFQMFFKNTKIYVIPSTSGLCRVSKEDKLILFKNLFI